MFKNLDEANTEIVRLKGLVWELKEQVRMFREKYEPTVVDTQVGLFEKVQPTLPFKK